MYVLLWSIILDQVFDPEIVFEKDDILSCPKLHFFSGRFLQGPPGEDGTDSFEAGPVGQQGQPGLPGRTGPPGPPGGSSRVVCRDPTECATPSIGSVS